MAVSLGLNGHARLDDCGVPSRLEAFSDVAYIWGSGWPDVHPRQPGVRPTAIASALPAKIGSTSLSSAPHTAQRSDPLDPQNRERLPQDQ